MYPIFKHLIHDQSHCMCVYVRERDRETMRVREQERETGRSSSRKELTKRGSLKLGQQPFLAHFTNLNHVLQCCCQTNNSHLHLCFIQEIPYLSFIWRIYLVWKTYWDVCYVDEYKVKQSIKTSNWSCDSSDSSIQLNFQNTKKNLFGRCLLMITCYHSNVLLLNN